jgi:hypothetical protein
LRICRYELPPGRAKLHRRVFVIDPLECPSCGGTLSTYPARRIDELPVELEENRSVAEL